jgi:hypothetical protein
MNVLEVFKIALTLGDAFSRRKQIEAGIQTWINRLKLAGRDTISFQTKKIEGDDKFKPIPGTKKDYDRNYTIEECRKRIQELIEEDKKLALRISLTNQVAKAKIIDLDGTEKELTVPELLVLKNDIAPKLEQAAQAIPKLATGVEITETTDKFIKWQTVMPVYKVKQSLSEQGHKIEEEYIDYYNIQEVTDYGMEERKVFDEVDRIHAWQHRLKEAINQANKTELINL